MSTSPQEAPGSGGPGAAYERIPNRDEAASSRNGVSGSSAATSNGTSQDQTTKPDLKAQPTPDDAAQGFLPSPSKPAPGLFDGLWSTVNDLSQQATGVVGDWSNTVINLGTHATKMSTSLAAAEEQWRELFPAAANESQTDEKLRCFFFCNLLTNIGPCPGTLFVTQYSLYFVSDQELEFNVDPDEVDESQYRVSIPLNCISGMAPKMNPKNDVDRYIQLVTADQFDFWFTGFIQYDSAFANLLSALHDTGRHTDSLLENAE